MTLNLNFRYADTTPYDTISTPSLPEKDASNAMCRFDLTLSKKIGKNGEIMLGVLNLFNRVDDYMMDRGALSPHKTPGRIFTIRLQLKF